MAVIDLRRQQGPSAGQQIADMGQNMLQFFMQREQLQLQKEQQGLREKAFKLEEAEHQRQVQRQAEEQQGQVALLQQFLAQQPPEVQQQIMAQFEGGEVPGGAAAPLVQGMQQQQMFDLQGQQIQAQIGATEAQRERTIAETEIARARLPMEQRKLEIEERLAGIQELSARSQAELNKAQVKRLDTERRLAPAQIAMDIAKDRRDMFASAMREFQDPAMASFIAYGAVQRPNERDMVEGIQRTVSAMIEGDDFDPAQVRQLVAGDPMTDFATRIGIGPTTLARYSAALEQLGDKPTPQAVQQAAQSIFAQIDGVSDVMGPNGMPRPVTQDEKDAQKAAAKFFIERATGKTINIPEKEKRNWLEMLKRFLAPQMQAPAGGAGQFR